MKKRAVIVHCWGGYPNYAWYPWVQEQLEAQGYEVTVPEMPDTDEPALDEWLPYLQEIIGKPDEELVLVGHSIGCVAIMRYLEALPKEQKVGKVVFVAGFTDQLGFKELENFFKTPLNFEKIKPKSERGFAAIQSDDDPYVPMQYGERLEEELDATLIVMHAVGHMSGDIDDKASCTKLPEVVSTVTGTPIRISKGRTSKTLRNTLITVLALLIVLVGGGVGYTYYMDKQGGASAAATIASPAVQPVSAITPHKTAANAPESASIELLSSPVALGTAASISAKTQPASQCTIIMLYKNVPKPIAGAGPKMADDFGTVEWDWTVSRNTPIGTWPVRVTCTFNKKTAVVQGNMQITAK